MAHYNYSNKEENSKDNTKGHKIAAALYLVTNHLSDTDPVKTAIRTHAVNLVSFAFEQSTTSICNHIHSLLEMATLAGLISDKNASIISLELRHYAAVATTEIDSIAQLFTPVFNNVSFNQPFRPIVKSPIINENKSKRQDAILSFINERKSAAIKDIAALFSDTSEKTIQRELGALVTAGKITKRGEKRWSVYMSV
jgi:predicted HTH transcriptional regulator